MAELMADKHILAEAAEAKFQESRAECSSDGSLGFQLHDAIPITASQIQALQSGAWHTT